MSIIEEIKAQRAAMLTEEQKGWLLAAIKTQLETDDYAIVDGASHYCSQSWNKVPAKNGYCAYVRAPYKLHAAIADWLCSLGFHTSRYYNNFGVDNGLKVTI